MYYYLLPLSLTVLLLAAQPSLARDRDVSGIGLYKVAVTTAKLQVQPVKASYQVLDEKEALKISQSAIGNQLGDYTFLSRSLGKVRLSDYRGKPLVISMIYTHCPSVCATTTRNLNALKLSRDALGADSFGVLTIGFDTENDTPGAMDDFAKRMDVKLTDWEFVSADPDTIKKLSKDLGFVYFPSAEGGFEHITQTTFIDGQGRVYQQVYGEEFDNKTLLEPLKNMIYNIKTAESGFAGLSNKIRLFCTVYDAKTGAYKIDYSYFYGIGLGILVSLFITWWIVIEYRRSPKRSYPHHV
ncbi:MAG: SCO family protein [Gallionella sp.]